MAGTKNPLQKQLDHQKFLHAIDYVRSEANGLKKLSTTELSRTNQYLCSKSQDENFEPWRFAPVHIQIPGGASHRVNVISNPMNRARELIGTAIQMSGNGQGLEAASYLYAHLVLEHLFKEANRRTAVAAALWILLISGYDCDAEKLLAIPIGDLRNENDLSNLKHKIEAIVSKN